MGSSLSTKERKFGSRNKNKSKSTTTTKNHENEGHITNQLNDPLHYISNRAYEEKLVAKGVDLTESPGDTRPTSRSASIQKPKGGKTTADESSSVQTTVYELRGSE